MQDMAMLTYDSSDNIALKWQRIIAGLHNETGTLRLQRSEILSTINYYKTTSALDHEKVIKTAVKNIYRYNKALAISEYDITAKSNILFFLNNMVWFRKAGDPNDHRLLP